MKVTALIATIASVNAACECLGATGDGMPDAAFFEGKGYPSDYGTKCSAWDVEAESCLEGGADNGKEWCTNAWCYVAADNDCDPAAYDTVFFAGTDYAGLKFATTACPADAADGDASSALMASVAALSLAAVAASI